MFQESRGVAGAHVLSHWIVPHASSTHSKLQQILAVKQGKTSQHGLDDRSLFQAPTLLMHPDMGQVNFYATRCHVIRAATRSLSHVNALGCEFAKKRTKMKGTAFIRSCTTLQLLDRVFDFHRMCAESEKEHSNRYSIRAVHCVV